MAITTGNWAQALYPGIRKWFDDSPTKLDTMYTEMFDRVDSKRAYEETRGKSNFGYAAIKPQGSAVAYDVSQQGFLTRITNTTVGLGFIVTREMREDDLYGVVAKEGSESLRESMDATKETIAANIYNRAETGGYTGGDGDVLLSTTHDNVSGGTYSNRLTTAAALSEASLEQAGIDIMKLQNDRGLRIKIIPNKLILPVDLGFEAERILNTQQRVATADNDLNAIKKQGLLPGGFITNPYITNASNWFIRTNVPGMICQERRAMEVTMDNDHDTENAKYKATARYAFGWDNPRSLFGSSPA